MEPEVRERLERLEGIIASVGEDVRSLAEVARSLVEVARSQAEDVRLLVEVARSLVEVARSHEGRLDRVDERLDRLALAQQESHEELSVLIRMMDEWVRRNPGTGAS